MEYKKEDVKNLGKKIGVSHEVLLECVGCANILYHPIQIPKRNGTFRIVNAPEKKLKRVQRAFLDNILKKIEITPYVYGFSRNKNIVENARAHKDSEYLLSVDIVSFFPSVHCSKVGTLYRELGFSEIERDMLLRLTTLDYCLPQGAPTSPAIATLCLKRLDERIAGLCSSNRLTYTRYFDDIAISGNKRATEIVDTIRNIVRGEGYKIHEGEKLLVYGPKEIKKVTGVEIENGTLVAPDVKKVEEEIEAFLHDNLDVFGTTVDPYKILNILQGKIAFITQVSPEEGSKMKARLKKNRW